MLRRQFAQHRIDVRATGAEALGLRLARNLWARRAGGPFGSRGTLAAFGWRSTAGRALRPRPTAPVRSRPTATFGPVAARPIGTIGSIAARATIPVRSALAARPTL